MRTDISVNRTTAYKLAGIQFVITILVASLLFFLFTTVSAYSVLIGGLAYILPNVYFVRLAFRSSEQQTPHMVLRWLYIGEAGKLVLTGAIFAVCFALVKPINVIALFIMYIFMLFVNLAGMGISKKVFTGIH